MSRKTTSPSKEQRWGPVRGIFYVWANSIDKAVIELSRGNAYTERSTLYARRKTGLKPWRIEVNEVIDE